MLSFVRPHAPYDAPQWYFDLYRNRSLRPPVKGDWDPQDPGLEGRTYNSHFTPSDPELELQQQAGYYACITLIDHQIGRFLDALHAQCAGEDNVIFFTSDHGELLGDHNLVRKSYPYQGSIHIPMLIHGPERLLGSRQTVSSSLVELRDVMPTLLNLAGADIPASLDGRSMLPGGGCETRDYLHGEHSFGGESNHFIVTGNDKYIWYSQTGREQYFDLKTDPGETKNRIQDPACTERIAALRSILIRELEGREEGYSDGRRLITGKPPRAVLSEVLFE